MFTKTSLADCLIRLRGLRFSSTPESTPEPVIRGMSCAWPKVSDGALRPTGDAHRHRLVSERINVAQADRDTVDLGN